MTRRHIAKKPTLPAISDVHSLTRLAYETIKEAIISLKLKPGEKLKESMLAEQLQISTTPIRGALTLLQQEGLIKIIPFKGAFVAEIDDHDVEEIFKLRELLEGAAVKRAATTFSTIDLQKGDALLEKMRRAYKTGDMDSYAKASRDFHDLFIEKFGNQRMVRVLKTFDDQLERVRLTAIRTLENIPLFIGDYEKILEGLKAKNPEAAERALLIHLKRAKDAFSKSKGRRRS
jgi:DNA-binding GntR family transcriptional regulator